MNNQEIIRDHMVITGSVQGVGFRYRAYHLADMLGVTDWVRNEWDGSVELEVQGTQTAINELLTRINQGSYVNIEDIRHKRMPVDEQEHSFHVR
jgi:acylphosphatase